MQYYQLATLRPDGRPANRTVVHRGFFGDNGLTLATDRRYVACRAGASHIIDSTRIYLLSNYADQVC